MIKSSPLMLKTGLVAALLSAVLVCAPALGQEAATEGAAAAGGAMAPAAEGAKPAQPMVQAAEPAAHGGEAAGGANEGAGHAAEGGGEEGGHATIHIEKQSWSFAGPFGKFDTHQLQRGFQVFREVCAACHGARLLAFRNLQEAGGPQFTEGQVKALAAEYSIADPEAEGGSRPAVPADRWPAVYASDAEAREAFGGVAPPDLSVMAKARGVSDPFPSWVFNYFTGYAEGGPDYIHALMLGYRDPPPAGAEIPEGKYYNEVFPGHAIGMPPPLSDGAVDYAEGAPETVDQYSRDVSAFLMWLAEPHMVQRKEEGFRVITFLILFAALMWFVKDRLWRPIHHHNPSPRDVTDGAAHSVTATAAPDRH